MSDCWDCFSYIRNPAFNPIHRIHNLKQFCRTISSKVVHHSTHAIMFRHYRCHYYDTAALLTAWPLACRGLTNVRFDTSESPFLTALASREEPNRNGKMMVRPRR